MTFWEWQLTSGAENGNGVEVKDVSGMTNDHSGMATDHWCNFRTCLTVHEQEYNTKPLMLITHLQMALGNQCAEFLMLVLVRRHASDLPNLLVWEFSI